MRKIDAYLGGALWVAVAVLLPMTALEPVSAKPPAPAAQVAAADSCEDGTHLVMGCAGASL